MKVGQIFIQSATEKILTPENITATFDISKEMSKLY